MNSSQFSFFFLLPSFFLRPEEEICSAKLGASIVDALDTLLIMGLDEEANKAKHWIINELDFNQVS